MEVSVATQSVGAERTELPGLIRDLLKKRGFNDEGAIERFIHPNYVTDLGDPFLMTDMDAAVGRIIQAVAAKEKVAVYGDYDIDGIASTTLMLEVLEQLGLEPISYIPDRYEEGYGIHTAALEELKQQGVSLVVSVDCGITSVEEAKWARENDLDLIITDHHDVPEDLPEAVAVVNPKRPGDEYPFKELAGVGVAFAVARALQRRAGSPLPGHEKWLLDLVALGTVCDVMPLIEENRVLVKFGLIVLKKTRRVGLVALAQSAGIELADIRAYHLGYVFGPRLNAAGRVEHANYSLELVTTRGPVEAQAFAFQLEELNHQRQLETARITEEADALAEARSADPVLVLSDPGWPHGVVGIVASRLSEKWGKPTLVLQIMDDVAKGSGRSAGGYNLIAGLRSCEELFGRLGGHHFAAGFTLPAANLEAMRQAICEHYRRVESELPPKALREADIAAETASDLGWELVHSLELLEPYGNANQQPAFGLEQLKVVALETCGKAKQHLKLRLAAPDGTIFQAIGFDFAEKHPNLRKGQVVDVICYVQKNVWQGRESLQLNLISLQ